jgi:hypothetical protein
MKLVHKEVPVEFLAALPEGIKYVQKQGKIFWSLNNCTARTATA